MLQSRRRFLGSVGGACGLFLLPWMAKGKTVLSPTGNPLRITMIRDSSQINLRTACWSVGTVNAKAWNGYAARTLMILGCQMEAIRPPRGCVQDNRFLIDLTFESHPKHFQKRGCVPELYHGVDFEKVVNRIFGI